MTTDNYFAKGLMDKQIKKLPKLVVLLGPTASGKTGWSLQIAKQFQGEIISADSRQIYKKMDIGTAKPLGEWRWNGVRKTFFVDDIPHHLVDFIEPGEYFNVAEFRDRAIKYCKLAYKQNRLPIIVGGTGLYISALIDNWSIPRVPPNRKLRHSLQEKDEQELLALLQNLDPLTAQNIDSHNKRRIIRALEVCILTGEPFSRQRKIGETLFTVLQIGVEVERSILYQRIEERTDTMMKLGLLKEVELLARKKYGWNLPSMNGIGYREFKEYFEKKITLDQAIAKLKRHTKQFARRQITWFRHDSRIQWCQTVVEAEDLIKKFLQN